MNNTTDIIRLQQELEQARHENRELSMLTRSMELINLSIDLDTVLDYLMQVAKEITHAEASSALLLEDEKLCFIAASGTRTREIKRIYLDKHEGIAGWVVQHGTPLLIPDVVTDTRFARRVDASSGFVTRSILAVPLKIEDRLIGVVEAVNKRDGATFDENDTRLLVSLASSAAMAIHKAQLYRDLNNLFLNTIKAMANAIEAKDPYTRGHSERIRNFSLVIGRELGLAGDAIKDIEISALLHDVGKIGVPEAVLRKQGKLTDEEAAEIQKHPVIGATMLADIRELAAAIPGIRHHQERYDGKGYPDALSGEAIPLLARIIAVADTFDAMTSDRPYRKGLADDVAIAEIRKHAGVQFDPACAAAFIQGYEKGLIKSQRSEAAGVEQSS